MFTNNKLSKAVRLAVAFGAASTAVFTGAVVAQEAEEAKDVERIEVTGSRIKRTDLESASPIFVMDREAIESAGQVSIGDILQQIPAAGAALNTAFNNGGNGATNMDLRNLGAQRLLVLVNGRRWISSLGSTVDLNTIPTSSIERVEVLKDGASALYGSDAIAGVVNIITRKDFEGVEFSTYAGENASKGDGRKYTAEMTLGTTTEKSGILFNMSHTTQQPIWAGDRDVSDTGFSSTGANTRIGITRSTLSAANQAAMDAQGYTFNATTNRYDLMTEEGTGANTGIDTFRQRAAGNADNYNFAPDNYLVTPQNRNSFYIQGYHDINDNLRFVADFVYTNRKSEQELAPMPVTLGEQFGASGARVDIHADNIYNPFGETLYGSSARAIANGYTNYTAYSLQRRMVEAGPRNFAQDDDTYRGMVGLEGNFGDTSWSWDAHYIYGQNSQSQYTTGLLNLTRINQALGANCTAATNCTPLNLFGGPGSITADMLDYITFDSVDSSGSDLKDYAFNTSGDLFEIPGGTVGAAVGFERREESGFDNPDPLTVTGESSGNQRDATSGGFRLDEAYAEISIPLMENLLLSPAMRFSDHSVFGNKTTAKVGLEYRPMDDLLLRTTWAEGYRAPSINDLFAGNSDSFPNLTDPCNRLSATGAVIDVSGLPGCAGVPAGYRQGNTQIRITQQSSPDLKPEESESLTVGFVYNPSWLEGAELTVDYYNIEVTGAIARIGAGRILSECAQDASSVLCDRIDRDSNGNVVDLRNGLENQGSYDVSGIDTYVAYRLPETSYGTYKVYLDGSYFIKNEFNGEEQLGIQYGDAGYPRIKASLGIDWMLGDWNANYQARYVHHMDTYLYSEGLTAADGITEVLPTYIIHDVSVGYNISDYNAKVTLGVENLFAKEPTPEGINNGFAYSANNYSVTEYDSNMDRFVYLRASVKF
ncbi:TonB-dependent receptor [Rheinheimera mesophila]|uniref:TonB-dependent receptor n=1 Tax=Rheinheimera mesophila TaxID=1547515 RepID=A0A3P3QEL9_9GAMM|nr:TonB-dependent receptor [Rheinheimera mesophila]KKL00544.1 TonB-dependent receptor [Rheinheimera mesophila]RRJ19594.1 TonB-dependent receptor [Rheinheimera mesophila]